MRLIKLPGGDWINPACIQVARHVQIVASMRVSVWFANGALEPMQYYDDDAVALIAALDTLSAGDTK